jgi:peptidoglycan/xylan/chitin deacetylase (PgdA/CDA1 family)
MVDTALHLDSMPLLLMYHSVAVYDDDPFQVTVSPQRFGEQMRLLDRLGIRGSSVRELLEPQPPDASGARVGLTFDDGYQDFFTEAAPILAGHGFSATVFVVAGRLGGCNTWDQPGPRKALMTAEQVRMVAAAGMEVGSHGLRHVPLPELGDEALRNEVRRSRDILQDLTGQQVSGFCYPYDTLTNREVAAVRDAGYEYGCAVFRSECTGRYALPRTYIGDRDRSLRMFAKWIRHRLAWGANSR